MKRANKLPRLHIYLKSGLFYTLILSRLIFVSDVKAVRPHRAMDLLNLGASQFVVHPQFSSGLIYSSFLGGGLRDYAEDIVVDDSGAVYITGSTQSTDFPTSHGTFATSAANRDVFIAKINPAGDSLVYAVVIGGNREDIGSGISVENGVAYVTGTTNSSDFPFRQGARTDYDAFVLALNQDGTNLNFVSFLGGSGSDYGYDLDVEAGEIYVTGATESQDFPASGYRGNGDAFVARLLPDGQIGFTKLLGSSLYDVGFGIAVLEGEAFITGAVNSTEFPTSFQKVYGDVFVARYNREGVQIFYSLFGGGSADVANAIVVDAERNSYITGRTDSSNIPGMVNIKSGKRDAFAAQLDPRGKLIRGMYLGGSDDDEGSGITLYQNNRVFLSGFTQSGDFPVSQSAFQQQFMGGMDGFFILVDFQAAGSIQYSSYLGGASEDVSSSITLDGLNNFFITGNTQSGNFPTSTGAFQPSLSGIQDVYVSKFEVQPPASEITPSPTATVDQPDASLTPEYTYTPVPAANPAATANFTPPPDSTADIPAATPSPSPGILLSTQEVAAGVDFTTTLTTFPRGSKMEVAKTTTVPGLKFPPKIALGENQKTATALRTFSLKISTPVEGEKPYIRDTFDSKVLFGVSALSLLFLGCTSAFVFVLGMSLWFFFKRKKLSGKK